jgi:DNA-binding transcriptional ArsR family regulator
MEAVAAAKAAHFDAAGSAGDYAALAGSREHGQIAACLAALESYELRRVAIPAQTAFWLNVFNAAVLRDAAELAAARSVRAVEGFFERTRVKVMAFGYSLDDIEHGLLRGNAPKFGSRRPPMRRDDPRLAQMPLAYDERMHFGMYSASRSSPALTAFNAGRLDEELEDATARYLRQHVRVENDGALVVLPRQFYWYPGDFGGAQSALTFALARLEDEIVEPVDRRRGRVKVRYAEFDWRLNARG